MIISQKKKKITQEDALSEFIKTGEPVPYTPPKPKRSVINMGNIGMQTNPDVQNEIQKRFVNNESGELGNLNPLFPKKEDPGMNQFYGTLDDTILYIGVEKGGWDIMGSMIPSILKYCKGDIVEIGMGESTLMFSHYAQQAGVNLYSCDLKIGGMFDIFEEELFPNHYCYIGRSEDFIKEYSGSPAIVFIDGEHKSETVRKEVEFFLPIMSIGGVMFLHDTMPMFEKNVKPDLKGYAPGDTYKVRQELERDPRYDVLTWPYSANNMGLTMVMIHGNNRPYWKQNGRLTGENV